MFKYTHINLTNIYKTANPTITTITY